jgi:DNA-directed RNA polymerase
VKLTTWNQLTPEQKEFRVTNQKLFEEDLLDNGIEKYWKEYNRAVDEGKPEQLLLESAVIHLTPYYQKWIDTCSNNRKSPDWLAPLLCVGAAKMADITIRNVMRLFLTRNTIQSFDDTMGIPSNAPVAQQVAKLIADDVINIVSYQQAKKKFSEDWRKQSKFIKNWTIKRCKAFTKKVGSIPKLKAKEKEDLGHNMLRIALSSDILVSRVHWNGKNRKSLLVCFAPWILKELSKRHELLEAACLVYRPMICPPIQHTAKEDGGFLSPWIRKKMIKRYHPVGANPKDWDSRPSELVLRGLNALSHTEWSVNKQVYDVMKTMFENDYKLANLPAFTFKDYAFSRPYPEGGTKEEQAKWMQESNEAWGEWYKEEQSRSRMIVRLQLAKKMLDWNFFYMPYTLDFRGRAYSVCELLSPQGVDFDRGLIQFAMPRKQTERGLFWLKVHLANLFDQDKKPFNQRVKWVDDNMEMLLRIAEDPYSNKEWIDPLKKKNKSFQRLAAIFEIARKDGMTQLNIQMDGANNGGQHWSAIMKNRKLAKLTNLLNSNEPEDLYQHVADASTEYMKQHPENNWYQVFLLNWDNKLPRSVTKRPTMCDAYGLTFYGMQKYVKQEGHVDWVPKESRGGAVVELSRAIQAGLGETMESPNKGKEWLREVAEVLNAMNKPFVWTTPSGFEVHHVYNQVLERVSYAELFNRQQLVFATVTEDLDGKAQYLAISPNFIHALDAAHMFMTIGRMLDCGMNAFSMVHDSFGTYATDIDHMHVLLREQFVLIHKENQLEKLKKEVEEKYGIFLPDCPEPDGEFDVSEVLGSEYFFA